MGSFFKYSFHDVKITTSSREKHVTSERSNESFDWAIGSQILKDGTRTISHINLSYLTVSYLP